MSFSTQFLGNSIGVLHIGSGKVTGREILDGTILDLQTAQQGHKLNFALVDFSAVSEFSVSADEIREIAREDEEIARLQPKIFVAIVAPADHIYGIGRMWQAYIEQTGWTTSVFRDRTEAEEWLRNQTPMSVKYLSEL